MAEPTPTGPPPPPTYIVGDDVGGKRLHPATLVLEVVKFVRAWFLPIVLVVFVTGSRSGDVWWLWPALFGALITGTASVLHYVSFRYGIESDRLVIRSGIVFRQVRTIPLWQVQNVHLKSGPIHRLFRVVEVRLETAGAGLESEAHLSVVGARDAEEFRSDLLARRGSAPVPAAEAAREVIHRSRLRELLLAGATENRVGVLIAGLFALFEMIEDLRDLVKDPLEDVFDQVFGQGPLATLVGFVAGLLFLVVAGWIVSIFFTLLTYFRFVLWKSGNDLRKQHGLLTRYEATVPLLRIQVLRVEANALRRLFGFATVRADTAGSAKNQEEGGTTVLCPLLGMTDSAALARAVYPDLDLEEVVFRRVHPRALRRGFVRIAIPALIGDALLAWAVGWQAWLAVPVVLLLSYLLARARYRALGWARRGRFLLARAGVWTLRHWIVPESKVQSVTVSQSPIQRWLGLATLFVATAGTGPLSRVQVTDLATPDAEELLQRLSLASAASGSFQAV